MWWEPKPLKHKLVQNVGLIAFTYLPFNCHPRVQYVRIPWRLFVLNLSELKIRKPWHFVTENPSFANNSQTISLKHLQTRLRNLILFVFCRRRRRWGFYFYIVDTNLWFNFTVCCWYDFYLFCYFPFKACKTLQSVFPLSLKTKTKQKTKHQCTLKAWKKLWHKSIGAFFSLLLYLQCSLYNFDILVTSLQCQIDVW